MTGGAEVFRPFSGRVWRIPRAGADPLAPVVSTKGRFHHGGQPALYAALSPEGAGMALATYARPGDPPRLLRPLDLEASALPGLRDPGACAALGVDPGDLVARWSEDRAAGRSARSRRAPDRLRGLGLTGALHPSRKAGALAHVVPFATRGPTRAGPPVPWRAAPPPGEAGHSSPATRAGPRVPGHAPAAENRPFRAPAALNPARSTV